jgi:signal transduction histidine kinase
MDANQVTLIAPHDPDRQADLQTVLAAWHSATLRLQETHETLRGEVCRLTNELEVKNRELARKNRLADLGQMASHIAHEVRNSLVPVSLYMGLLRRRISGDRGAVDIVDKIQSGFVALDSTVNDLLSFTADRDPQLSPVNISRLVEEVYASLAPQLEAQTVECLNDVPDDVVIHADRAMLRRAFLNLVLNAVDVLPDGGRIVTTSYAGRDFLELEIADSGPGLSEEQQRRAFEPFYSTKSGGTGLGLAIVYRVAEVHGGDVAATNCPEGGAAFTLRIPVRRPLAVAA